MLGLSIACCCCCCMTSMQSSCDPPNLSRNAPGVAAVPLLSVCGWKLLHVRVLHQEGGAQLAELADLDLARAVLIDLFEQVLQLLLGGTEAHRPHDLAKIVGREEVLLLRVEQV